MEHPQGLESSQKRQRIAQDAGGYIKHPDPGHWMGGGNTRRSNANIPNLQTMDADKLQLGDKKHGSRVLAAPGFSSSSSSDRLTEEQENEIAENIYDWWISGKSYKKWYAEKFQQMKLDF